MLSSIHQLQQSRLILPWIIRQQSRLIHDVCKLYTQQMINEDDSDDLTLTKEAATSYLENVLQIQDPFTFAQKHKFEFLCEVQRRTRIIQPFSTVVNLPQEGCPTKEQAKESMFKKQGGGCIQINSFTKAVLRQLGYQAFTVCATLPKERTTVYEAHVGLVVKDVTKKGSMHLVEPGTVHPILDPISLDFDRSSSEYQLIGYPIKFFRDSPSIVKLCMPISKANDVSRDANLYYEDGKMWRAMITYRTLAFQNWEYCNRISEVIKKNPKLMPDLHKDMIIFGYSKGVWTIIKGKTFVQYDKNEQEIIKQFKTNDEVIENTKRCFPQYSKDLIQDAIAYTETTRKLLES